MPVRRPVKRASAGRRRSVEADDYRDDDGDEEEEERPRTRRKVSGNRNSSTRSRPNPRKRGSRRDSSDDDGDDEEEEEKPRRKVSRGSSNRSNNRRSRRDDDDEEDDEKPRGRRSSPVRSGWGGAKETRAKSSGFAEDLDVDSGEVLTKFLEDEPFASYRQHWADWRTSGKRSFICLEDDCPLCDIGDRPSAQYLFNVADLTDEPINKQLRVGVQALGQIENLASGKMGPLSKNYWVISRSKKKGKGRGNTVAWNFTPVKERDLEEDWEMEPLTDEEFDDLVEGGYDSDIVQVSTRKELMALAREAMDDGDDTEDYDD